MIVNSIKWLYHEFGLSSVWYTGRDAWIIMIARSCRMFAFAFNALILALFFSVLKFTDGQIGMFMTLTLFGDVFLGFFISQIADRVGRRRILLGGSFFMVSSGIFFALFDNYWILLFGAVVGVLNPLGGDFGPFRSIEESILSTLTDGKTRSDVLAWYVTLSNVGVCVGSEAAGLIVESLIKKWDAKRAYHATFWIYALMGVVNVGLVLCLSNRTEAPDYQLLKQTEESNTFLENQDNDDKDAKDDKDPQSNNPFAPFLRLFTDISAQTRSIMYKLWFLLMVDCLADGMVPFNIVNYYLDKKFKLSKATLGHFQSVSYFLSAFSLLFAAPLSRRIGLINTMVFTHIPSSAAVLLFPLPTNVPLTIALLFVRVGLNSLDQAPRSAFIAAVVKPSERTAVMGITAMLRTLAATAGPSVTGVLADHDSFWVAFVTAGVCRLAYDFGLWGLFVNMKISQHGRAEDTDSDCNDEEMQELPTNKDQGIKRSMDQG